MLEENWREVSSEMVSNSMSGTWIKTLQNRFWIKVPSGGNPPVR